MENTEPLCGSSATCRTLTVLKIRKPFTGNKLSMQLFCQNVNTLMREFLKL